MKLFRYLFIFTMLFFLAASTVSHASAQEDDEKRDSHRELVYHVNAYQGSGWQGVFHPQSSDTIYILSGQTNTLTPRYTMVFFWTITQRYKAEWTALNEVIESRLEISKGRKQVALLDLEDYVLQDYSRAPSVDTMQLFMREEAHAQSELYLNSLDAWWEDLQEYYAIPRLERPDDEPDPPQMYSTEITKGFLIDLDPGTYHTRLVDESGQVIPESEKKLVVFEPRRKGIGYTILPEKKWTVPDYSANPDGVIYSRGDLRLFLQPQNEAEYYAYYYKKMLDPQLPILDQKKWEWIPKGQPNFDQLILRNDRQVSQVPSQEFTVNPLGGDALGYTIDLHDPSLGEGPNFSGHELRISLQPGEVASIWLADEDGKMIDGSQRELRGISYPFTLIQYLPALLPLVIAFWLIIRRARLRNRQSSKSTIEPNNG
jgi:hypothetical protein